MSARRRALMGLSLWLGVATAAGCGHDKAGQTQDGGADTGDSGGDAMTGTGGAGGLGGSGGAGGGGVLDGIVVDSPSGVLAANVNDGVCDLLEAVEAVLDGATYHDCANPGGIYRTIILQGGFTYPVPRSIGISGTLQIKVTGAPGAKATIQAAPGWTVDVGDPSSACLFFVFGNGTTEVELHDVVLTQGPSLALTGVCAGFGSVLLRNARVTGFQRSGVAATCLVSSGCDHERYVEDTTTVRLVGTLVDTNYSPTDGGGVYSDGSGATVGIYHSAIINNRADGDGGGVYFGGGWATDFVNNSTVSGNHAAAGGGLMVKLAEKTNTYVHVLNSTITDNTAQESGGGIEFQPADIATATQDVSVFASIIAGNHSVQTFESDINAAWFDARGTFNCARGSMIYVAPGFPKPTESDQDCRFEFRNPLLGALTPLGGTNDLPLHPLLPGSPAIDGATIDLAADQQRDPWVAALDGATVDDTTLFDRVVDGDGDGMAIRDLGAYEWSDRWQTELLELRAKGAGTHQVVTSPAGYDRGAGTRYAATSASNEFVTYVLPVAQAGYYDLSVGLREQPDAGQFQLGISTSANGPWDFVGPQVDTYAAEPKFAVAGPFPTKLLPKAGEYFVRVQVSGKNDASGGYQLLLDYLQARRSAEPCPSAGVAAGGTHTCAVLSSGGVRCWGDNQHGQLGTGTAAGLTTPPAVDALADATAVATGASHTCALTKTGGVRCWGFNTFGQLGTGSTTDRNLPPATDVATGVQAVTTGDGHTCVLTTAGGVRCWGRNDAGQLGDGTMTNRSTPPTTDALTGVKAISAGGSHTCALMATGGVRCWGLNVVGQLGDGTTMDRAAPPTTDVITGVAMVSAGARHTCVVTTAGGVRCWGRNADGELGDGSYLEAHVPPTTDVLTGMKAVAAGLNFTCALSTNAGVRCWGYNSDGQLGDDTELAVDRLAPATTDVLGGVASMSAGYAHFCVVMTTGGVRCWGANDAGQLGDGLAPDLARWPPPFDLAGIAGTCATP